MLSCGSRVPRSARGVQSSARPASMYSRRELVLQSLDRTLFALLYWYGISNKRSCVDIGGYWTTSDDNGSPGDWARCDVYYEMLSSTRGFCT